MRKFFATAAIAVGLLLAALGSVALLKKGANLLGIVSLGAGGVLFLCGLALRLTKKRRAKRSSGRSRKRPSTRSRRKPQRKEKPKPVSAKPVAPRSPREDKPTMKVVPPTDAPEISSEEEKEVPLTAEELIDAFTGVCVYKSESAVATVRGSSTSVTEDGTYVVTFEIGVTFTDEDSADEEGMKSETNRIVAAVNDRLKALRSKLDASGVPHDLSASYDFGE